MLNFLPMILGALQGRKDDKQAQQRANMQMYMGQAPTGEAPKSSGGGLVNGLAGMLQGSGKSAAKPGVSGKVGNALSDPKAFSLNSPLLGASGGGSGASSYNADNFQLNAPQMSMPKFGGFSLQHSEPDAGDFGGPSDNDEDNEAF